MKKLTDKEELWIKNTCPKLRDQVIKNLSKHSDDFLLSHGGKNGRK